MSTAFFDESRVDSYFLNARQILEAEGKNPTVTVDVFPNGPGILCGIEEALDNLISTLPDDAELWSLPESN